MKRVQTQLIILNGVKRIRLIFNKSDISLMLLLVKLPGCRWSPALHNWHIEFVENYISFLNKSCPDYILFYDLTPLSLIRQYEETTYLKKIIIDIDNKKNNIRFSNLNDTGLIKLIRNLVDNRYLHESDSWNIRNSESNLISVMDYLYMMKYTISFEEFTNKEVENITLTAIRDMVLQQFREEMELQNYSKRTIDLYIANVSRFLKHYGAYPKIDAAKIISYIHETSITGGYSRSSQNQVINSIKLYFRLMFNREIGKIELPRPRREYKTPEVLSASEIEQLIASISNLKHRTMINTIHATGIRPSELLELKPGDVDYAGKNIFIRKDNENNERLIPLSTSHVSLLSSYILRYRPEKYLFEGSNGNHYSARSLQKIFKSALVKANIKKSASIFSLRHSLTARLLESGTDLHTIQQILGYSSRKSTETYTNSIEKSRVYSFKTV